jgi:hypothetical protein
MILSLRGTRKNPELTKIGIWETDDGEKNVEKQAQIRAAKKMWHGNCFSVKNSISVQEKNNKRIQNCYISIGEKIQCCLKIDLLYDINTYIYDFSIKLYHDHNNA